MLYTLAKIAFVKWYLQINCVPHTQTHFLVSDALMFGRILEVLNVSNSFESVYLRLFIRLNTIMLEIGLVIRIEDF